MKREHDIEDMFRDDSRQNFEFKEEYWDEMSQLLDERDRTRGLWKWFSIGLPVAAAVVLVGWGLTDSNPESTVSTSSDEVAKAEPQPQASNTPEKARTDNTTAEYSHSSSTIGTESADDVSPSASIDIAPVTSASGSTSQHTVDHQTTIDVSDAQNGTTSIDTPVQQSQQDMESSITASSSNTSSVDEDNPSNENTAVIASSTDQTSVVEQETSIEVEHSAEVNHLEAQQLEMMPTLSWEEDSQEAMSIELDLAKYRRKGWHLALVASAGIANELGNQSNSTTGVAPSATAGVELGYELKNGLFFRTGAQAFWRSGLNQFQQRNAKMYSFGAYQAQWRMGYSETIGLEVPLTIGYRFNRHEVYAGAGFQQLFGAKYQIETAHLSDYVVTKDKDWVSPESFTVQNFDIRFGYNFMLNERLGLGAEAVMGLKDMTIDDSFGNRMDRDMQLRGYIRYRILRW